MKYYIPIAKKPEDEKYYSKCRFYESISELFAYYNPTSPELNFDIAEVKPIRIKHSVFKENYKVIKVFSLDDLIKEYEKTKKSNLIALILKHKDIKEEIILSILDNLKLESSSREIIIELKQISYYHKITKKIISKVIEVLTLPENFRDLDIFIVLIKNTKINETLLEKIFDKAIFCGTLNEEQKLFVTYAIIKSPKVTTKLLKKIFTVSKQEGYLKKSCYYTELSRNIAHNEKTDSDTLDELVSIIGWEDTDTMTEIAKNPNTLLKSLVKLFYKIPTQFLINFNNYKKINECRKIIINIINNPNVSELLLKKIIKKCLKVQGLLEKIIQSPKITFEILNDIIQELKDSNVLYEDRNSIIAALIDCPILTEELLEEMIEICDLYEVNNIVIKSNILNYKIINKLYEKVNTTADLELFMKLLFLEKKLIRKMCEDKTCDNKLSFKKEYLKILNKYLKSDILDIRFKVLEEMVRAGYLKSKYIIDQNCIKECPRSPKLCYSLSKIQGKSGGCL